MNDNPTYEELEQKNRELKRQLVECKQLAAHFRCIFRAIPDATVFADTDRRISTINPSFVRKFGYEEEELLGRDTSIVYSSKEDYEEQGRIRFNLTAEEKLKPYEVDYRKKSGEIFPAEVVAATVKDDAGNAMGFLGILRDITECKRAEEALRESEDFRSKLLDSSPNPIIAINPDTSISYVNPALGKFTGFSSEELIGRKTPYPFWRKDMVSKIQDDMKKAMQKGAKAVEEPFQNRKGEPLWVEITSIPIMHEGKIVYYLANWVDITQRKQVEKTLRENEEKYKNLFEFAGDALFILSVSEEQEARFVDCNDSTLRLFGCAQRDQIIGKPPEDFSPSTQPDGKLSNEKVRELIKAVMEGQPQIFEWAHHRLDGAPFLVEVNLSRIKIKGEFFMQAVVRDITNRKTAENKIRKMNEELELRVEERTNELQRKNIALTEVLGQIEVEKQNLANRVNINVRNLLLPIVKKLRGKASSIDDRYLQMIEQNLDELTSEYGQKISESDYNLTPKEIEICGLIKNGFTGKEIADMFCLSERTVETHRFNIRKKLGISSHKVNLAAYLAKL